MEGRYAARHDAGRYTLGIPSRLRSLLFLLCLWFARTASAGEGSATPTRLLAIPWMAREGAVDARLGPWRGVPSVRFAAGPTAVVVRVAWSTSALRVLCEVGDATPVAGATSDEDPALASKSDSIEILLDTRGEHSALMDTNDYQFTISRDGRRTTFKGSAALAQAFRADGAAAAQPKDWGMNIPIEIAVADGPEAGPSGNAGYRVEIAVPWAAVGGAPSTTREFGLSVAVNDLSSGPSGAPVVHAVDWEGRTRFESPAAWRPVRLEPPSALSRFLRRGGAWLLGVVVLATLAVIFLVRQRALRLPAPLREAAPVLPPGEALAGAEDPVERLRTGLMPRLREDLTADDLASIAGVSLRTLQRLFRERFDTSPMTWLMEARLSEAARLIRAGDDPVTKIAYRVGFKDPSHFTRRFKGRFGVSPNEYRRADTPPAPLRAANPGDEP
jgi:AraC-like DNA-binding protein